MTDSGYNVFWTELDDNSGRRETKRRHFSVKSAADQFAATLGQETQPRVYEAAHTRNEERDTIGRDDADALNRRALVELMLEHNITIPAKRFDNWRPTVRKTGRIEGIRDGLTCLMTDGLLGYFLTHEGDAYYGHVTHFMWDEPDITRVPNPNFPHKSDKQFITIITDQGAPRPLNKRPRVEKPSNGTTEPKVKKARQPMTAQAALELIKQLSNGRPQT